MRNAFGVLAAMALLTVRAAPAADTAWGTGPGHHSSVFAGAYLRLSFAGERAAPSQARAGLRLSLVHQLRGARAPLTRHEADALDLRFGGGARPTPRLAGHELSPAARLDAGADQPRGFNWWIPVAALGGAALIGGAVFLA